LIREEGRLTPSWHSSAQADLVLCAHLSPHPNSDAAVPRAHRTFWAPWLGGTSLLFELSLISSIQRATQLLDAFQTIFL